MSSAVGIRRDSRTWISSLWIPFSKRKWSVFPSIFFRKWNLFLSLKNVTQFAFVVFLASCLSFSVFKIHFLVFDSVFFSCERVSVKCFKCRCWCSMHAPYIPPNILQILGFIPIFFSGCKFVKLINNIHIISFFYTKRSHRNYTQ